MVQDLQQAIGKLEARLSVLEKSSPAHRATAPQTQVSAAPRPAQGQRGGEACASAPLPSLPSPPQHVSPMRQVELPARKAAAVAAAEDDEDDDIDLFGSDEEEDKEAVRLREERLRQYAERKATKPALVAKSSILLDVKPVSARPAQARSRWLRGNWGAGGGPG